MEINTTEELHRLAFSLSDEDRERIKVERMAETKALTSEYQFGYFVGEYIVEHYLPCLNIDMFRTSKLIRVSSNDKKKHEILETKWRERYHKDSEEDTPEWEELQESHRKLEHKYLPHELICCFDAMNILNEDEFKRGLYSSLWGSDVCHYNVEPSSIVIETEPDFYFTNIKLKLD